MDWDSSKPDTKPLRDLPPYEPTQGAFVEDCHHPTGKESWWHDGDRYIVAPDLTEVEAEERVKKAFEPVVDKLLYDLAQLFNHALDIYYVAFGHQHPVTAEVMKQLLGE